MIRQHPDGPDRITTYYTADGDVQKGDYANSRTLEVTIKKDPYNLTGCPAKAIEVTLVVRDVRDFLGHVLRH